MHTNKQRDKFSLLSRSFIKESLILAQDERVQKILKAEEISIGPYVLTGGELPTMIIVDALARHIPGVLGKAESLEEKRYGVGVPAYTRPEILKWRNKIYRVPKILLLGDHKKIGEWRSSKKKKGLI